MAEENSKPRKPWSEHFNLLAEIAEEEEKFYANHWANDHLETPHVLINIIETKISRAVLAEQYRIRKAAENWISELEGHDGECNCSTKAEVLKNFIEHSDFTGKKETNENNN